MRVVFNQLSSEKRVLVRGIGPRRTEHLRHLLLFCIAAECTRAEAA